LTSFIIRFVSAGTLVGILPWLSNHLGARVGGFVLLFPAVTLCGFMVILSGRNSVDLGEAAKGALLALPAVAVFVLTTSAVARLSVPGVVALACGVCSWLVVAAAILTLT